MRPILMLATWGCVALTSALHAQGNRYLEDFDYLSDLIGREGAAVSVRDLDWKRLTREHRAKFAECQNDRDHVVHVMELLALLGDGHTSITRTSVPREQLPSKFEGLFGAGMWFAWDNGLVFLRDSLEPFPGGGEVPRGSALIAIDGTPGMDRLGARAASDPALPRSLE